MINNSKHGIVFWITGYPGSGKIEISSFLQKKIEKKFGKTIRLSGDDLRILYDLKGYTKKEREKIGKKYHQICKKFSLKGINVLIDVVCLFDSVRKKRKNIQKQNQTKTREPQKNTKQKSKCYQE